MTFRTKLLVVSSITLAGAVALTTGAVSILTRRAFDRINEQRRTALVAQLQKQLEVQSRDVEGKAQRASAYEGVFRLAVEASRAAPDLSAHYDDARPLAEGQSADFLDLLQPDGTIISSAHWPARFAYKNDWQIAPEDFASPTAFLTRVPVPEGKAAVAMVAVRPVAVGEKKIFVAVGKKLDATFLASMGSVPGTRTLLWLSPQEVLDANGPVASPDKLGSLATQAMQSGRRDAATIQWSADRYDSETVFPIPLTKRGTALGVLLVATSLAEQLRLERSIVWTGVLVGGAGILLGILIGWWATERITRPIASLSEGVRAVASGDWSARVPVSSADEIGELASSFNRMTEQLVEQRDRTVQAERVAAWRELARRLAHELKNPLFPLQITVENMKQARDRHPEQFDEVFRESTSTLLAEIGNLKTIIGPNDEVIDSIREAANSIANGMPAFWKREIVFNAVVDLFMLNRHVGHHPAGSAQLFQKVVHDGHCRCTLVWGRDDSARARS